MGLKYSQDQRGKATAYCVSISHRKCSLTLICKVSPLEISSIQINSIVILTLHIKCSLIILACIIFTLDNVYL